MSERRADSIRVVRHLFQDGGSGAIPTSALSLWVDEIRFSQARQLNALWHSRLPRIGDPTNVMKPRVAPCFAAIFDGMIYAIAIWSHPVSRVLPQKHWLELRRLAIAPDAPKNTASRMLAVMTRLIRKQMPNVCRLVSYHDMGVHTGCIYRAAGWVPTVISNSGTWNAPARPRPASQSTSPKQRWEKVLVEQAGDMDEGER
jgi:hypothetical protein